MRILSLANITPYPARGGVHLRVLRILERIAKHHDVTLGCHTWDKGDEASVEALNGMGIKTVGAPIRAGTLRQHGLPGIANAIRGIPPETVQYQSPILHDLVARGDYDLLHIEETLLTPYARSVPPHRDISRVLTLHNVHFAQDKRIAAIESSPSRRMWKRMNAEWMRHYEPRVISSFDRVIAVSEADRALLLACDASLGVDVIANGVDTKLLHPLPRHTGNPSLLFVGSMAYKPCADAAMMLVREIAPLVRRAFPKLEIWIVGKSPPPEILELASARVYVLGEVPEVVPYYQRASLSVVPLRAGGGTRLKILEAMALGRAVVSTTVGAEGLHVSNGDDIILADSAQDFADAVVRLLSDDNLATRLERGARQLVEREYDWDDLAKKQLDIYDEIANRRHRTTV